ncbi:MAG: hypothetical protein JSW39_00420 [Desulfobacterales bacterium]|nr:MAG: hypothetical protein JSW39_00420 [Desulfobacterales bacterium]
MGGRPAIEFKEHVAILARLKKRETAGAGLKTAEHRQKTVGRILKGMALREEFAAVQDEKS